MRDMRMSLCSKMESRFTSRSFFSSTPWSSRASNILFHCQLQQTYSHARLSKR